MKILHDYTNEHFLLQEIKNGNSKAFEYLFKSYYPRLRGYASRFIEDNEAVCDLLQECFMKFWEKRQLIEAISLTSLLFAMVRNACLNYLKHQQLVEKQSLYDLQEPLGKEELYSWDFGVNPEHKLLYEELNYQINQVLQQLPERCREVFIMSRFKQLKNREIADMLQISTTAVEKHISKALKVFSTHFKEKYPFELYVAILVFLYRNI